MLKGKKIVIGITGSIAAYKIPFLVRLFVREGADVRVIMTPAAKDFVTPLTLTTLARNTVIIDPFKQSNGEWNNHVELGSWADVMIFAPVTANTLGKMAHGIADNFLVTAYLSAKCPVFIAPAMDLDMYAHPSTRENIRILRSFGNKIVEPQVGELASGLSGPGRMEEPEKIMEVIRTHFLTNNILAGRHVLITAGPTYEAIDPVRFIGNHSSGLMGISLAEEAASRGAKVTLVCGPTDLKAQSPSVHLVSVTSAEEMRSASLRFFKTADITIMAAAVSDYSVAEPAVKKIKKSAQALKLELKATPDILKELGTLKKRNQLLVGFALETDNGIANARKKLSDKNLDLIILNSLGDKGAGFKSLTNKITLIFKNGKERKYPVKPKREVAGDILDVLQEIK